MKKHIFLSFILLLACAALVCASASAYNWNLKGDCNGRVTIKGLSFCEGGFSLTSDEGGGGYVPAADEEVLLTEDHG